MSAHLPPVDPSEHLPRWGLGQRPIGTLERGHPVKRTPVGLFCAAVETPKPPRATCHCNWKVGDVEADGGIVSRRVCGFRAVKQTEWLLYVSEFAPSCYEIHLNCLWWVHTTAETSITGCSLLIRELCNWITDKYDIYWKKELLRVELSLLSSQEGNEDVREMSLSSIKWSMAPLVSQNIGLAGDRSQTSFHTTVAKCVMT